MDYFSKHTHHIFSHYKSYTPLAFCSIFNIAYIIFHLKLEHCIWPLKMFQTLYQVSLEDGSINEEAGNLGHLPSRTSSVI